MPVTGEHLIVKFSVMGKSVLVDYKVGNETGNVFLCHVVLQTTNMGTKSSLATRYARRYWKGKDCAKAQILDCSRR
jgi:hypothetical protein